MTASWADSELLDSVQTGVDMSDELTSLRRGDDIRPELPPGDKQLAESKDRVRPDLARVRPLGTPRANADGGATVSDLLIAAEVGLPLSAQTGTVGPKPVTSERQCAKWQAGAGCMPMPHVATVPAIADPIGLSPRSGPLWTREGEIDDLVATGGGEEGKATAKDRSTPVPQDVGGGSRESSISKSDEVKAKAVDPGAQAGKPQQGQGPSGSPANWKKQGDHQQAERAAKSQAEPESLQLLVFNEEFLVSASHQLALTTSLPFVHTARRSYRLNGPVKFSDRCDAGGRRSRNKVSVGEPAEGSLSRPKYIERFGEPVKISGDYYFRDERHPSRYLIPLGSRMRVRMDEHSSWRSIALREISKHEPLNGFGGMGCCCTPYGLT
ncbi:hypothetical protein M5K25_009043 [Dendrobium thyrsiflorum]|uniref:Uncharacterized protein n=1 Tax=Dendrobium thyrsiflorum TaxID=117978 RepID=A0ABD0V4F6_DENTH